MRNFTPLMLAAFALASLLFAAAPVSATVEYSEKTGEPCSACHVNPLGGGELTDYGEAYMGRLVAKGGFRQLGTARKLVRLVMGYLHILAGVVWFGTIFYVHILLKPAYASKGLPKGELILGWTCIAVVGVTGTLLTIARMHSFEAFYSTRFGALLLVKISLFLVMAGTAALVTFVLGPKMQKRRDTAAASGGVFTPAVLAGFDGKDGRPAYVAVDGRVYDVSGSPLWKDGKHTRHMAGMELGGAIAQAPHGPEKLEKFPAVGSFSAEGAPPEKFMPRTVFYVVAYMNLVLVFLVLGVVALWRWW